MKFTQRRQQKKSTVTVSKQTAEQALQYANTLKEYWSADNENDPRIMKLDGAIGMLQDILNKNPQQMAQDGVSSVEEYFDTAIKPDVANRVKAVVDQISQWRQESRSTQINQEAPVAAKQTPQMTPAYASAKKKADGGAAFSTDRDEKGEAKAPEKIEVPRLAAKDKKAAPAAVAAPVAAPVAPATAPIPEGGSFDIKTLSTEALAKAIKALVSIKDFEQDKSAQALIEAMTAELKTRPVETDEPKAAPAAAAPVAAPPAAAPAAAPVVASSKKADSELLDEDGEEASQTLYLANPDVELDYETVSALEKVVGREVGVGVGYINIYTTDPKIMGRAAEFLKQQGIQISETEHAGEYDGTEDLNDRREVAPEEFTASSEKTAEDATLAPVSLGGLNTSSPATSDTGDGNGSTGFTASKKKGSGNSGGAWSSDVGEKGTIVEDGGRTPEVSEAHADIDEAPAKLDRPATTAPIKLAAEMSTSKALKEAESLGENLKRLYLDAKALTNVNDTRPVREAVEAIFRAADLFNEATKTLSKQNQAEESEAQAAKIKDENKGKKSSFRGLSVAAAE